MERNFPVMGTVCSFRLVGEAGRSPEEMALAADAVQESFREVERICSRFDEKSELSSLNRNMHRSPVKVSLLLWGILVEAKFFHSYTSGAFDVTIAPLMGLWGFHRKKALLPSREAIARTKAETGLEKVVFGEKEHSLFSPSGKLSFDLGGIAKGFALDYAAETAAKHGIRRGLLDLGGNLRSLELPPGNGKKNHIIGIRDPRGGNFSVEKIELPNGMSIATSGNYERYVLIGGIRYTHIIDPRTGSPVSGMLSATVLTRGSMWSDALSTSVFILGESFAEKVCSDFPETSVLLFREEKGKILRRSFGTAFRK
ncbi:MAG: FAD:protein FMN transferase [Lentisphaeria bacterium]|nr:FAD:protein FMN transferase [Lentisphaeria bacterium]